MSTTSKTAPRPVLTRVVVVVATLALARPTAAAPASGPTEAPATVEAALAAGDLETARTLAETARVAEPSPENWRREAEVCTRLADLVCAREAWQGHLAALPKGADRGPADAALQELEDMSRGTVADEGPSRHRDRLDRQRAEREAAAKPAAPAAKDERPKPAKRERIVKKWYFWVTTLAIAAAAGAITGIAIQAARDERADALDERTRAPAGPPPPPTPQGFGLRF